MKKTLDALVITDANSETQRGVLDRVVSMVGEGPINWEDTQIKIYSPEECKMITEASRDSLTREEFMQSYAKVAGALDINRLLRYSQHTDSILYNNLRTGMNVSEALWDAYQRNIVGNWNSATNYFAAESEARERRNPNVLEVLFNHNVISADFGNERGIPYHLIGRGFVAEGCRQPLKDSDGKMSKNLILLPLGLYSNKEDQLYCAQELVNHEMVGHMTFGLKDHSARDISPNDCIMSVPESRQEFVDIARKERGLVFCKCCENGTHLSGMATFMRHFGKKS